MAAFGFLLCLMVVCSAAVWTAAEGMKCHDDDHAALVAIDAALSRPYHFASWTDDASCCDWYDVDCDGETGRVVSLSVTQDANLSGAIPEAIANLTYLRSLVLHHLPAISGAIPDSLAALSNLSQLTISYTAVSGPVPSFLGALTELTLLDLSYNSLAGAIPPELADLPSLSSINLSRNRLAGAIPPELADLPSLSSINLSRNRLAGAIPPLLLSKSPDEAYLWLSRNNLSGAIPAEFAAVSFASVDLSRNALTGDPSGLFGRGKPLQRLDLSRNALSFNLSGAEFPEQLYFVDVSHNGIRGGIPAQVTNLTNLQFFNVSFNRMCGAVPAGGNMARFDRYSYLHNKCLCGAPLSACRQRPVVHLNY